MSSCNTLEPVFVDENWQNGVLTTSDEDVDLFNAPRRSRQRNPPFQIIIDFDQYRRNRKYKGRLQNFQTFENIECKFFSYDSSTSKPVF